MTEIRISTSGFTELQAMFAAAGPESIKEGKKVVGQGLNNMKKDAQRRVSGYSHLPHLPRSFTYDVTARGDVISGEVGAEHGRLQGKLDVFIEFGTPTSAPIPHWAPAADAEEPRFYRYTEDLAAKALGG